MNHGGYREGSGRSNFGYYKGIYCGSTYELCWVIYNLEHNISFKRFTGFLTDGIITYYPDFLIDDSTIVEIKGYHTPLVDAKTKLAESKGYKVKILYKNDLEYAFEYVRKKYNISNKTKFHTLYDNHKPKFKLICEYCKNEYESEKDSNGKDSLCSRVCSGKYRFLKNRENPDTKNKMCQALRSGSHQRKLTDEQVKDIFTSDDSYATIAKRYSINKSMVSHIKNKKTYVYLLKDL